MTAPSVDAEPTRTRKVLIILQAGVETHGGRARGLHAILYANELRQAGMQVRLIFDGAGTEFLARLHAQRERHSLAGQLFAELQSAGLAYEVCDFCSGAFEVRRAAGSGWRRVGGCLLRPSQPGAARGGRLRGLDPLTSGVSRLTARSGGAPQDGTVSHTKEQEPQ